MKSLSQLLLVLIILVAWPLSALADEFNEIVAEGFRHYEEGNYDQAIEKFFEAKLIEDQPELTYNIARAYDKKGECQAARKHYDRFLQRGDAPEKTLEKAKNYLAELGECPTTGTLSLACNPKEAMIQIDGHPMGPCGPYELDEGPHVVVVTAEGYEPQDREVKITAGQVEALTLNLDIAETILEPVEQVKPDQTNWIAIGLISAGGALLATTAVIDYVNYSGNAKELEKYPVGDWRRSDYEDSYETNQTVMWVTLGLGATSALVGTVLWATGIGVAESQSADLNGQPSWALRVSPMSLSLDF